MRCPNCSASVPEGASFCEQCGTRLQGVCASCGTAFTPGSRYCRSCGAFLQEQTAPAPPPSSQTNCPRCHSANEPGASFCYSCGLPFDEEQRLYSGVMFPVGRPAGFWIRVVAALIDGAVMMLANLVLIALWPGTTVSEFTESEEFWTTLNTVALIGDAAYYTLAVAIWSTTIGKRVVGIYVLRPDGSRVGVVRALARYLAGHLSAFLLFAGYLMVAFRRDKRGLHDLICDTAVVYRQ